MIEHGIKVQCFRITPYDYNKNVFIDIDQIIPVKESEEYMIKMADKNSTLYRNISPSYDHWLSCGAGISGIMYNFIWHSQLFNVDITNKDDWNQIKEFLYKAMINLEKAIKKLLKKVVDSIK